MLVGYARVSTKDQNPQMQIDSLTKAGCEKIYQEKASGSSNGRPELAKLLAFMREGDILNGLENGQAGTFPQATDTNC